MTTLRLAILACVACCAASSAGAQSFPYTAYVNAGGVYLRSGPDESYYAVAKLDRGQQVEVYRHDPGGWCAIRPPADCFSWVSAEFIEPRHGSIGVVTGDRVVARVGSAFSDARDVIQVRLHSGEEVEILEAREFNFGPAARTWYKISPPAGEFRWVPVRCLERRAAEPMPGPSDRNLPTDWQTTDWQADEKQPDDKEPDDEELDDRSVRLADHEAALPLERAEVKAGAREDADDLDLALSAAVAKPPAEWELASLRRRAATALDNADTALDRGRIRRVLRKIDNFAEIQRRYRAVTDVRGNADRSNGNLATAERPASRSSGPLPLRYDGIGRLTQLTSVDPRLPQFALVNAEGKVAAYVSPAPGVNLRRYLNQEVGINGALGYLPERQAQHLTAKRVVPVEGRSLR